MMVLSDIEAVEDDVQPYIDTQILRSSDIEEALVEESGGFDLVDTQRGEELGKGAARAFANGDIALDDEGTLGTGMYGKDGQPSLTVLKQEVFAEAEDSVPEDSAMQVPDKPSHTSLPSTSRRTWMPQWLGQLLKRFGGSSEK